MVSITKHCDITAMFGIFLETGKPWIYHRTVRIEQLSHIPQATNYSGAGVQHLTVWFGLLYPQGRRKGTLSNWANIVPPTHI